MEEMGFGKNAGKLGVDFTNVLCEEFMLADPKSAKRLDS